MANEKWKCTNFDHCDDADRQTIVQIPRGRAFICPNCGGDGGIRTRTGRQVPGWLIFASAGVIVVALLIWALIPPHDTTSSIPATPAPKRLDAGSPPARNPNTGLPERILTRPFAVIYDSPSKDGKVVRNDVPPFSSYYVFTKPSATKSFYEVGLADRGRNLPGTISGWVSADDVIPWEHSMVAAFTHPAHRNPVLMFKEASDLDTAVHSVDRMSIVKHYYQALDSRPIPNPFPILSVEPRRVIDTFYMMPILEAKETKMDGRVCRQIKFTAAAQGRGASTLQNVDYVAKALASNTPDKERFQVAKDFKLDVVFVMDLTGSMQPYVDATLNIGRVLSQRLGASAGASDSMHFGLWGYQDDPSFPGIQYRTRNFTTDLKGHEEFVNILKQVKANRPTNDDYPEDVFSGVRDGIKETHWTPGAARILVLIGDAPSHKPSEKGSGTGMDAAQIRQIATDNKVRVAAIHIRDYNHAAYAKYHQTAEAQFRTLSSNEGSANAYLVVDSRDAKAFSSVLNDLTRVFVDHLENLQKGLFNTEEGGTEGEKAAKALLAGATVDWVSAETKADGSAAEPPRDVTAWAVDRDLLDSSITSLSPKLLLTKNQLDDLGRSVRSILDAVTRHKITGQDFFDRLLAAAATSSTGDAKTLLTAGVVPSFLKGLPYHSDIMDKPKDWWQTRTDEQQVEFQKELEAKINYYQTLHDDPKQWHALNDSGGPGEYVAAVPLEQLP